MFYIQHIEKTLSISKALSRFGCRCCVSKSYMPIRSWRYFQAWEKVLFLLKH